MLTPCHQQGNFNKNLHSLHVHLPFVLLSLPSAEFSFVFSVKGTVYHILCLHIVHNTDMNSIKIII